MAICVYLIVNSYDIPRLHPWGHIEQRGKNWYLLTTYRIDVLRRLTGCCLQTTKLITKC